MHHPRGKITKEPHPSVQDLTEEQRRAKNRESQRNYRESVKHRLRQYEYLLQNTNIQEELRVTEQNKSLNVGGSHAEGPNVLTTRDLLPSPCGIPPDVTVTPPKPHISPPNNNAYFPLELEMGSEFTPWGYNLPFSVTGHGPPKTHQRVRVKSTKLLDHLLTLPKDSVSDNSTDRTELVESSLSVRKQSLSGSSLLHQAVLLDNGKLISTLLKHGADVQAQDKNGQTPLHYAALAGHIESGSMLLSNGADRTISSTDKDGLTPIHLAVQNQKASFVKLLIEYGADANSRF
ncbi:unnamed protein product [Penicillium nalgiovense]|nr:unnamed protein product [Penicillium nalgiovense]